MFFVGDCISVCLCVRLCVRVYMRGVVFMKERDSVFVFMSVFMSVYV